VGHETGPPRQVRPGCPADLVVLRAPLARVPALEQPVRAVLAAGAMLWTSDARWARDAGLTCETGVACVTAPP